MLKQQLLDKEQKLLDQMALYKEFEDERQQLRDSSRDESRNAAGSQRSVCLSSNCKIKRHYISKLKRSSKG